MGFFRFVFSKVFVANLMMALVVIVVIMWVTLNYLSDYTQHQQTVAVPNIKGYTVAEADSVLAEKGLRYVISDSVYYKEVKRGTIIEQDPLPNQQVKDNRTIYLVVNAMSVPIVPIPELIDLSLRQALATLNTYGFVAGDLEYVPDLARDAVIAQKINGKEVKAGDLVKKGTIINLVMGGGLSDEQVHVPLLIGLKREQALKVLRSGSLNRGAEFFDKTVITSNDTMEATIWKQIPKYGKAMISLGTYVDIWLSRDKDKIELDSNAVHMVDSLGTE